MSRHYVEFQAVVLAAGKGSRLFELSKGKPKCLLPIQNRPMIWYPLKLLEKAGFTEAIVIVPQISKAEIISVVSKLPIKLKIDWVGLPESVTTGEDPGTADSIRYIYNKIVADLVVTSCDLIADIDIQAMFNTYRLHEASLVAMFFPLSEIPNNLILPGPKKNFESEKDFVGIDTSAMNRMVSFSSASDLKKHVEIQKKVIKKFPNFIIQSNLLDAHFYIIRKSLVDYLNSKKNIITLKGEFVPLIVKKQMTKRPKPLHFVTSIYEDLSKGVKEMEDEQFDDIYTFVKEDIIEEVIIKNSSWSDHGYATDEPYHGDIIRCYAHIFNDEHAIRVNNLRWYQYANFMDLPIKYEQVKISANANVKGTQIQNSAIDDNAFIDEKTSIVNSRIGANSKVMTKTRLNNSIIMENVTIGERCVIDNCIIANECVIEEGTTLKNCITSSEQRIEKNSNHEREFLTDVKQMMEI